MPLGRILVVGGESPVATLLRDTLLDAGYVVKVAVTGSEAVNLLPVFQPDVVLLDETMPELSDVDVLEHLRQNHRSVPVVMFTANLDEDAARQMPTRGAFDYVPKPQLEVLERIVAAAIASRRGRSVP